MVVDLGIVVVASIVAGVRCIFAAWGYGPAAGFQDIQQFKEGSIVLEVVDNKTNLMIWQAVAEGALTGLLDPQDAEEQVTRAVQMMLAKFPPPAVK